MRNVLSGSMLALVVCWSSVAFAQGVDDETVNVGPLGIATQSSEYNNGQFPASLGIDGNLANFTHTGAGQNLPSTWELDLRAEYLISAIVLYNRRGCCPSRFRDLTVLVLDGPDGDILFESDLLNPENVLGNGEANQAPDSLVIDLVKLLGDAVAGSVVRVVRTPDPDLSGTRGVGNPDEMDVLSLAEVEVWSPEGDLPPPPPPPPPLDPIDEGVNPSGWIRSNAWNMLFLDQDTGCGALGRMEGNWVAPYDLAEENPRPGDEWEIDFLAAESRGWTGGNVSDVPTWISMNFLRANALPLIPQDLVDFDAMAAQGRFTSTDNIVAISTTYVENTTDEPMRVYVCSASDDSVRVDVNNYTVTLVSACRGSAVQCQETRCADLAPGINKITAYVWEGGGGWRMAIGLQDENGQPLTDASEGIIFHGTGEWADDKLEGQFIDDPPEDCVEAGPPPPPDDDGYENVGPNGFATQSSEGWGGNPQRGIDGNTDGQWGGGSITHTDQLDGSPSWWEVDLQDTYYISYMRIWNRLDCCSERLTNFTVTVLDFELEVVWEETFLPDGGLIAGPFLPIEDVEAEGQFVRVSMPGQYLSITELQILSPDGEPPLPDEICDNGTDDDEDGDTDCDDADCSEAESCQEPPDEVCDNGIDDDQDGAADCDDDDCVAAANCAAPGEPTFVRGDTNSDGSINLTDGVVPLLYLFSGGAAPACLDSADTNDTGSIEITDAIIVFSWLFSGGMAPADPSPLSPGYSSEECTGDPTDDDIGCDRPSPVCN